MLLRILGKISLVTVQISVAGCIVLSYLYVHLPDVKSLTHTTYQEPLQIFTRQGDLIAEFGSIHRVPVGIEEVPKKLISAIIVTEDQRFYEHNGIDVVGLMRAANVLVSTRQKRQGASTITMQVARNFFLGREKTYFRKINEILLALAIERNLTKQQILELYVNKIYLGHRAYGVGAAARNYFGKTLSDLTTAEMAMIAGLPKAPSSNNPIGNPKKAVARRNLILGKMLEKHVIDKEEYEESVKEEVTIAQKRYDHVEAGHIAEFVRHAMVESFGDRAYQEGFKVYTTLDTKQQRAAQKSISEGLESYEKRQGLKHSHENLVSLHGKDLSAWLRHLKSIPSSPTGLRSAMILATEEDGIWILLSNEEKVFVHIKDHCWINKSCKKEDSHFDARKLGWKLGDVVMVKNQDFNWVLGQIPRVQGALVSVNIHSGDIEALVGGYQFQRSHFNRAIQAYRQPGSVIKPFLYAMALENGYTLASMVNDAPVIIEDMHGENAFWRPKNVDSKFKGPIRLRQALIQSRNLVTVRLVKNLGIDLALDYFNRFGFASEYQVDSLSLSLGSGLTTPLQMARAFSGLANQGELKPVRIIDRIESSHHDEPISTEDVVAMEREALPVETTPSKQAVKPEIAYIVADALHDVVEFGTGRGAKVLGRHDLYGKTGTTNGHVDAWFTGFNGDKSVVVWVGYDEQASLNEYAAKLALPIWVDFMGGALDKKEVLISRPKDVISVLIDRKTGLLAGEQDTDTMFELFTTENQPKQADKLKKGDVASEIRDDLF